MKFSIVVPVYNVEKYIDRCLNSIFSSTYKNFEVIIVNDGSMDSSEEVINKYLKKYKNIIYIKQENQGLSQARNNGVLKASGDYIIFVDSDDFIESDLLEKLNEGSSNLPDLIRFQAKEVFDEKIVEYNEDSFNITDGPGAFSKILKFHYVEPAWLYAYNLKFYRKNNFKFTKGIYHEDFDLVPYIIMNSKSVKCISYIGYDYYQRSNSIMNNNDYGKTLKKVNDIYNSFKHLNSEIDKLNVDSSLFKSYIANTLILKICSLRKDDYKKYKKLLKEEKVYDLILSDTLKRKIKKAIVKISPKLCYKILK